MKQQLVIHLADTAADTCWTLIDEKGALIGTPACGDLEDAAALMGKRFVRVLVPGADVLLTHVDLQARQTRQIMQAAPYALEESLAEEPERLHFAVDTERQPQGYPVAVVSRERMDAWLQRLDAAGIRPDSLESEVLAVPVEDQDWGLLRLPASSLLRTGASSGMACEHELFAGLLGILVRENSAAAPAALACDDYSGQAESDTPPDAEIRIDTRSRGGREDAMRRLAGGCRREPILNLLQGDYDRRDSLWQTWRPWLPALLLLVLWAMLEIGVAWWEKQRVDGQLAQVDAEIHQLVSKAFPGARNIPKGKERNFFVDALAALGGGAQTEDGFLGLIAATGDTIRKVRQVRFQGLSYRQGVMQISLDIPDLQVLDQLKQQLSSQAGLAVDIQGATAQDGRVRARLRIRGGNP